MKPTIKQIANLAGVSRGTVDRVLNNRGNVKKEVAIRVKKIATELNYTPNRTAKALSMINKPVKIGVLLPNKENHFFDKVKEGLLAGKNHFFDKSCKLIIENSCHQSAESNLESLIKLEQSDIDILLFTSPNENLIIEKVNMWIGDGLFCVTLNSDVDCNRSTFIGQDLTRSGRIAASLMKKLTRKGSHCLCVTGNMSYKAHKERVLGFINESQSYFNTTIVESNEDYLKTYSLVKNSIRTNSVNSIYMATGNIDGCIDAINDLSLKKHIPLITNDCFGIIPKHLKDGMIDFTITQDAYNQGYLAMEIAYNHIFNNKLPSKSFIETNTSIIIDNLV